MSRNLVLDKSQKQCFRKGDRVEILRGDRLGEIVQVLERPGYGDPNHMLVRASGRWPYTTVLRLPIEDVRPVSGGGQ